MDYWGRITCTTNQCLYKKKSYFWLRPVSLNNLRIVMSLHESVDKGRLSRWAFIVLLLFAVAFVIHTHVNTTDANISQESSIIKLASRPRISSLSPETDQSTLSASNTPLFNQQNENKISFMVEKLAAKVVQEAAADVGSVISMFKPNEVVSNPPLESLPTQKEEIIYNKENFLLPFGTNTVVVPSPKSEEIATPSEYLSSNKQQESNNGKISNNSQKKTTPVETKDVTSSSSIKFIDQPSSQKPNAVPPKKVAQKKVAPKQADDGRISFLDTNSATLQKQLKPSKQKKSPTQKRAQQQDEDLARIQAENNHPRISPRPGTDISSENQMALLLCPNQAKCIIPELQLEAKLKIYLCKHPTRHGVRFYYLAREGLMLHPNVELVAESAIETADYIIYLPGSAPWHLTEIRNASFAKRLIVLDEFDGHTLFSPGYPQEEYAKQYGGPSVPWYYMYFKRSYVRRLDGRFLGYPHLIQHEVYPLTYSIADVYVPQHFNSKREIEILCTLRGSKSMTTRLRVQTWVSEYGQEKNIQNIITGEVNTATRTTVSKQYFEQMFNAQIIVTVNPANWEGDFRLWEAMCTGALIFVDPVFVPHPFPLEDKVHVVFFSNSDRDDLFNKLDYYRANPLEARKIAVQGYLHAMKYHRTVNMVDYILRTAHLRRVAMEEDNVHKLPNYKFTGQYLHYEAKVQEKYIKACHHPGIYIPPSHPSDPVQRLGADCGNASTATPSLKRLPATDSRQDKPLEFLQ